jgi:hypothetical protein
MPFSGGPALQRSCRKAPRVPATASKQVTPKRSLPRLAMPHNRRATPKCRALPLGQALGQEQARALGPALALAHQLPPQPPARGPAGSLRGKRHANQSLDARPRAAVRPEFRVKSSASDLDMALGTIGTPGVGDTRCVAHLSVLCHVLRRACSITPRIGRSRLRARRATSGPRRTTTA